MNAKQIINYIPIELLQELCLKYAIDHQVKKLDGVSMFQLLLYSFLTTKETSYRVIEEVYHSVTFASVAHSKHAGVKYNSIRDRLIGLNPAYFESIYKACLMKFETELKSSSNIIAFDSTMVTASSKLLKNGMKVNKKGDKRYVKFTIGFRKIPVHSAIFTDQHHLSEDIALGETIMSYTSKGDDIIVFDRGLQSRKVLEELNESEFQFVTRLNPNVRYDILKEQMLTPTILNPNGLILEHDFVVRLYDKKGMATKGFYRLIITSKDGNPLYFLSNIKELDAFEIAHIYKQRWQIEVFFRFIKQQLNFSHLLSRDENGIQVVLYMTMIAALLLTVFKNVNNYKGYKIPKIKLANQLEALIIEEIVIMCGGNPQIIMSFYNSA